MAGTQQDFVELTEDVSARLCGTGSCPDDDQGADLVNVEHRRAVDRDERCNYDLHACRRFYRSGNELVAGDAHDSAWEIVSC